MSNRLHGTKTNNLTYQPFLNSYPPSRYGLKLNTPKKLEFFTQNLVKVYKVVFTQFRFYLSQNIVDMRYDQIFIILTLSTNGAVQP
jgi:hypothetical protein